MVCNDHLSDWFFSGSFGHVIGLLGDLAHATVPSACNCCMGLFLFCGLVPLVRLVFLGGQMPLVRLVLFCGLVPLVRLVFFCGLVPLVRLFFLGGLASLRSNYGDTTDYLSVIGAPESIGIVVVVYMVVLAHNSN